MRIISAPGLTLGLGPGTGPTTPLAQLGSAVEIPFQQFAAFARNKGSLPNAMYAGFIQKIFSPGTTTLPSGQPLYKCIVDKYNELEGKASTGNDKDREDFFEFRLYMYISIFYFSVWYSHNVINDGSMFASAYRDHVKIELTRMNFLGQYRLDPSATTTPKFDEAFKFNQALLTTTKFSLEFVVEKDILKRRKHILNKSGHPVYLTDLTAHKFLLSVVDALRDKCLEIIQDDVRQFLSMIRTNFPIPGTQIADDFVEIRQYAVGEGGGTEGIFGGNYAILFFKYEFNTMTDNPGSLTIKNVPLVDGAGGATAATILYFGLDKDFGTTNSPHVQLHGHRGKNAYDPHPDLDRLHALKANEHVLRKKDGTSVSTVRLTDMDLVNAITCDLNSTLGTLSGEEMTYLVFRHRLKDPDLTVTNPPDKIFLSTERPHADNEFQKLLSPASGTAPAVVEAAVFSQPATELAKLAAALAADPGFVFDAVIEGFGVGERLPPGSYGKGGRALTKAIDQSDRPPAPGYGPLRHDYGWIEWHPGDAGSSGWLTCHVTGFVSPARCTWEAHFPPAKKQLLDNNFKSRMVLDSHGRPIYNCLLSAFRAFSLFHAMVAQLSDALDAIGTPAAAAAKQKLVLYLQNNAGVDVILPTGMKMQGSPLKHPDIVPFY